MSSLFSGCFLISAYASTCLSDCPLLISVQSPVSEWAEKDQRDLDNSWRGQKSSHIKEALVPVHPSARLLHVIGLFSYCSHFSLGLQFLAGTDPRVLPLVPMSELTQSKQHAYEPSFAFKLSHFCHEVPKKMCTKFFLSVYMSADFPLCPARATTTHCFFSFRFCFIDFLSWNTTDSDKNCEESELLYVTIWTY